MRIEPNHGASNLKLMSFNEYNNNLIKKKYKVGLCLSGGGAKGFAYLGAFQAFKECGIEYDIFEKIRGLLFSYSVLSESISVSDILLYTLMLMQRALRNLAQQLKQFLLI